MGSNSPAPKFKVGDLVRINVESFIPRNVLAIVKGVQRNEVWGIGYPCKMDAEELEKYKENKWEYWIEAASPIKVQVRELIFPTFQEVVKYASFQETIISSSGLDFTGESMGLEKWRQLNGSQRDS